MALMDWFSGRVFKMVHGNNLVYNTCWEDPRLDRVALKLSPEDNVLVITSAGCNALDYALCEPNQVHAVDMNPRQNAVLELKIAAIRHLEYEDFFRMFGDGRLPGVREIYEQKLRGGLTEFAKAYWDKRIKRFFDNSRKTFYFRGTSGAFARMLKMYTDRVIRVTPLIEELLQAETVEQQQEVYYGKLKEKFWSRTVRFAMNRDTTLSMVGVPKAQRRQIDTQYEGGIVQFVEDCMEAVFAKLPLQDNYFWRVYMTGSYTPSCCPEYVTPEGFQRLRDGLVDRVHVHSDSVQGFLEKHDGQISRFILLDHMDWLSDRFFPLLEAEWKAILDKATDNARVLWRSGGLRTDFLNEVRVIRNGEEVPLPGLLRLDEALANELHQRDRVHTYGSFYIADIVNH